LANKPPVGTNAFDRLAGTLKEEVWLPEVALACCLYMAFDRSGGLGVPDRSAATVEGHV
jgi:hypothetical protein